MTKLSDFCFRCFRLKIFVKISSQRVRYPDESDQTGCMHSWSRHVSVEFELYSKTCAILGSENNEDHIGKQDGSRKTGHP
jgi:hypothetical protein